MKLLVVDDNEDLLEVVASALEIFGHTVDKAEDGAAAVDLQSSNLYDAVITDAEMPRLDGIKLCRYLKTNFPRVRIIGMSGSGRIHEFEDAGADAYLPKPFSLDALRDAIDGRFGPSFRVMDN